MPNADLTLPGLIGVPAVAWMWTETIPSFIRLKESMPPGSAMRFVTEYSTICSKRNGLVEMLLEEGLQWLLFVDSDTTVPADALQRLLASNADVVGGMYCKRGDSYCVCAGRVAERGQSTDPLRPTDDPGFRFQSLAQSMVNQGALEVDVCGTGVMLVHRHVFEAMNRPWFVANEQSPVQNEDFNFCLRARDLGFRIVCDTSVPCGHITAMSVTPSIDVRLSNPDTQLAAAVGAP